MIGTDIVSVARIEACIDRFGDRFLKRVYTDNEMKYCNDYRYPAQRYAARFAAKEAVIKALDWVGKGVSLRDIEITKQKNGGVSVQLNGQIFDSRSIRLSISHESSMAIAMAMVQEDLL